MGAGRLTSARLRLAVATSAFAALAGCGGDDPARSAVAVELAGLCDGARADIEALGLPSEGGVEIVKPWAERGIRLATAIGRLEGGTPGERRQVRSLADALAEYYAGLRLGYRVYTQTRSLDAYAAAIDRAKAFLERADEAAVALGAPECAIRPFPED